MDESKVLRTMSQDLKTFTSSRSRCKLGIAKLVFEGVKLTPQG
jgi:hypothetical protein